MRRKVARTDTTHDMKRLEILVHVVIIHVIVLRLLWVLLCYDVVDVRGYFLPVAIRRAGSNVYSWKLITNREMNIHD
jgi:hypothetical protein